MLKSKQDKVIELQKKAQDVTSQLVKMLEEKGRTVEQDGTAGVAGITKVDGVYIGLRFSAEHKGGNAFHSGYTGKLRMSMVDTTYNGHGRKNYPEPKVGFANPKTIKRIESAIHFAAAQKKHDEESRQKKFDAESVFVAMCDELGLKDQFGGYAVTPEYTVRISPVPARVQVTANVTPEQMLKIVAILKGE